MRNLQAAQIRHLEERFAGRTAFSPRERRQYSHDVGALPGLIKPLLGGTQPAGVVQPVSEEELAELARWASAEGIALVLRERAHAVFDHRSAGYMEEAMAATGGRGFDVILEMLANVNLPRDLKVLAMGGRVVVIGSRGTAEIDPRDAMARDASVVGMSLFNIPDADRAVVHAALVAGLENGTLRPVIGKELPLSAAAESHVAVMSPGARGKIVLLP